MVLPAQRSRAALPGSWRRNRSPSGGPLCYALLGPANMIVAIHQPHYLPWLGYLHRMAQADLFIVLDHVQFERRNHQNRSQIRLNGEAHWLTVPVVQRSQKERIIDKLVDNSDPRPWGPIQLSSLRHAYREAEHFKAH